MENIVYGTWHPDQRDEVLDKLEIIEDHLHKPTLTYPLLAGSVQLVKDGGAWAALPAPTEVIPAATVSDIFDIHWISISAISANGEYIIALYSGAGGSEVLIAQVPVTRNAVQSQEGSVQVITPRMAAGTRISAALSSGNAVADTVNIKVSYHEY